MKVASKTKVPNHVLRRIREEERRQTRAEFAESLARKAYELGESLVPSVRYIARLEDGEILYPHPAYRRALAELCGRSVAELGFTSRIAAGRRPPQQQDVLALASQDLSQGNEMPRGLPSAATLGTGNTVLSVTQPDWPKWFGIRLAHLVSLIERWQIQEAQVNSLQAVLAQEILMFDTSAPHQAHSQNYLEYTTSRRQTLMTLAALPLAFAANVMSDDSRSFSAARESFLAQCAASITACWHLLRGSDLGTVDDIMSSYLMPLEGMARQSSRHQRAAAALASQTHRVRGIVALHHSQLGMREYHCKQAFHYATVASDAGSQASALISLASTYFYISKPEQALAVYERALSLEAHLPPLQRSRVYAELSVVYGQLDRVDDAIRSAEIAGQLYPHDPTEDPSYLYAEFTPASLALEQGLAYLALAEHHDGSRYQHKAMEILSLTDQSVSRDIPDRIRYEIVNHLALASVLLGDAEAFEAYILRGIDGARSLGSSQREREVRAAFRRAGQKWPNERRLEKVTELLQIAAAEVAES